MKKQITTEDARKVLTVFLKCQSVIHSIDDLDDSVILKQEFKQRTNSFRLFLEKYVNSIGIDMDSEEAQYYIEIVAKLDAVTDNIKILIK